MVTLTVGHGTIHVDGSGPPALNTLTNNDSASVTLVGTIAALHAALFTHQVQYTPAANFTGPDTLQVHADDQGNSGSGGAQTADASVSISVSAINDPPVISVPATQPVPASEDTALSFSGANLISVSDPDIGCEPLPHDAERVARHADARSTSGLRLRHWRWHR